MSLAGRKFYSSYRFKSITWKSVKFMFINIILNNSHLFNTYRYARQKADKWQMLTNKWKAKLNQMFLF
jgi:hypothetical protein